MKHGKRELKRKMGLRAVLTAVLAVIFVVSAAVLLLRGLEDRQSDADYAEAEKLAGLPSFPAAADRPELRPSAPATTPEEHENTASPEPSGEPVPTQAPEDPYAQALRDMDFAALQAVNPDVVGWIVIPGTGISYPLLQGADNDAYLRRTWKGNRANRGSIFLESLCARDLSDYNTIIYGHRMRNGTMFAPLANYSDSAYAAAHPEVYIATEAGSFCYQIFAAYEAGVESDTYRLALSQEEQQGFLDYCVAQSVIDTGVVPEAGRPVLTLSTCTGNGYENRWVVQAVRKETPETGA